MMLPKGHYLIRNLGAELLIQRSDHEDKSLLPKRVISVPAGVVPRPWLIEPRGSESYTLKADGAPAFSRDHLIFVSLTGAATGKEFEWKITPVPSVGQDVYLIEKLSRMEGWVLPEEKAEIQVVSRPLLIGPSDPPFFPPVQLWSIRPA